MFSVYTVLLTIKRSGYSGHFRFWQNTRELDQGLRDIINIDLVCYYHYLLIYKALSYIHFTALYNVKRRIIAKQ